MYSKVDLKFIFQHFDLNVRHGPTSSKGSGLIDHSWRGLLMGTRELIAVMGGGLRNHQIATG